MRRKVKEQRRTDAPTGFLVGDHFALVQLLNRFRHLSGDKMYINGKQS